MAKKFEYPDMNNFKYLTRGCLVCGLIPNTPAHGLTPRLAVCDPCWVTRPGEAIEALNEAQAEEAEQAEEG